MSRVRLMAAYATPAQETAATACPGDVGEEGRGCGARALTQLAEDQQTHRG